MLRLLPGGRGGIFISGENKRGWRLDDVKKKSYSDTEESSSSDYHFSAGSHSFSDSSDEDLDYDELEDEFLTDMKVLRILNVGEISKAIQSHMCC